MDEKYKVIYRFKFHYLDHVFEYDSLTEAVDKFNRVLNFYNDLDYVKIKWGTSEIRCYEFE